MRHTTIGAARWTLLALLTVASGCGLAQSAPPQPATPGAESLVVTFAPTATYAEALRLLTDVGVQPAINCGVVAQDGAREPWQPMGQRAAYARTRQLVVYPVAALASWWTTLSADARVLSLADGFPTFPNQTTATPAARAVAYRCPAPLPPSQATASDTPVVLTAGEAGARARITFGDPLTRYEDAVAAVVDLGLAFTDGCLLPATSKLGGVPAHSQSQAASFAATHALVVQATKSFTSNAWQGQVRAVAGVQAVETPYTPAC